MNRLLPPTLYALAVLTSAAQAQNNWNAPGSACIPSGETVNAANHSTGIQATRFATGFTGTIELICPISRFNSGTTTYNLRLTYEDSTGTGTTAGVTALLYNMANASTSAVQLGSVTSNSSAATGVNTLVSANIAHTFDFEANMYWVRVLIKRAATSEKVVFYSVILDGTAF
jgi:hypothetical protein